MQEPGKVAGIIAGLISCLGFVAYAVLIVKGKNTPERVSWWIWVLVGLLLGESYYSSGDANKKTIWVVVFYILGPILIAILSIWYGKNKWDLTNKVCLGLAIASIVFRLLASPEQALVLNLVIDFIAVIPTIKAARYDPEQEDLRPWFIFFVGSIANLLAINDWSSWSEISYPIYMLLGNAAITVAGISGKFQQNK